MNDLPPKQSAPPSRGRTGQIFGSQRRNATGSRESQDAFAEINARTVADLAAMLGLPELKPHGNQRSPFRDERHPSFSVFNNGHGWKDHGSTEEVTGGDGVAFVMAALRCDHAGVRNWYLENGGIARIDGMQAPQRAFKASKPPKPIEFPGELKEGTAATWAAFAARQEIGYRTALVMAKAGLLRFVRVEGAACYCVTDSTRRAAEIRRLDGRYFGERKTYPLAGVRKDWLPGLAMLAKASRSARILITEGPSDFITAFDLYTRYRCNGGPLSWIPCSLLGAGCKSLAPEAQGFVRGRRVRLVPDGDNAGDTMAANWRELLMRLGCTVDIIKLPRGKDLSDLKGEIEPEGLFR